MISVGELARALGAEAVGAVEMIVTAPAEPSAAGPSEIALAMEPSYTEALSRGGARAAILWSGADWTALGLDAAILAPRPRYVLAGVTRIFEREPEVAAGVHPTAVIDPTADIGDGAAVGPFVVIGARVRLGERAVLHSHVSIGEETEIGSDARLHAGVRIGARIRIGARFIAQPGAVIGADGFSFVTPQPGMLDEARATGVIVSENREAYVRINSIGSVALGDDVELGANSCIDRGTVADTRVGAGTKIDNLVQVGHNVRIGETCLVCGHVAIGGSTVIGDRVVLGGKAAIADHITIGSDVVITGHSGVASNVPPNRIMMGYPAVPMDSNIEMYKALRRLPRLIRRLETAEKAVPNPASSD